MMENALILALALVALQFVLGLLVSNLHRASEDTARSCLERLPSRQMEYKAFEVDATLSPEQVSRFVLILQSDLDSHAGLERVFRYAKHAVDLHTLFAILAAVVLVVGGSWAQASGAPVAGYLVVAVGVTCLVLRYAAAQSKRLLLLTNSKLEHLEGETGLSRVRPQRKLDSIRASSQ